VFGFPFFQVRCWPQFPSIIAYFVCVYYYLHYCNYHYVTDGWALRNCRHTAGQSKPRSSGLRHCLESPVNNRPVMRPAISEERVRRGVGLFVNMVGLFRSGWPGCVVGSDWLRVGRSGDRIPVGARFSTPVQTGPGAHPASCTGEPVLSRE
jgi:hypothetical protein